jgi:hypothetical protein
MFGSEKRKMMTKKKNMRERMHVLAASSSVQAEEI